MKTQKEKMLWRYRSDHLLEELMNVEATIAVAIESNA